MSFAILIKMMFKSAFKKPNFVGYISHLIRQGCGGVIIIALMSLVNVINILHLFIFVTPGPSTIFFLVYQVALYISILNFLIFLNYISKTFSLIISLVYFRLFSLRCDLSLVSNGVFLLPNNLPVYFSLQILYFSKDP